MLAFYIHEVQSKRGLKLAHWIHRMTSMGVRSKPAVPGAKPSYQPWSPPDSLACVHQVKEASLRVAHQVVMQSSRSIARG